MRLINTTSLELMVSHGAHLPSYAILSHTWGDDEISFQDLTSFTNQEIKKHRGYRKISDACMRARRDDLSWIWIDTCCIDKSSSAELSEAINSMFVWYQRAYVCYAYLSDTTAESSRLTDICNGRELTESDISEITQSSFGGSRWFTRGWTLQELIAPREVKFYNMDWQYIGSKQTLSGILSHVTGIDEEVLDNRLGIHSICVARKMS